MASAVAAVFGRYLPQESPVHRMDPRAKLLLTVAYIVIALASYTPAALGACATYLVVAVAASRLPVRAVVRAVAPLLFIAAIAVVLNLLFVQEGDVLVRWWFVSVTEGGVAAAALSACRLALLLTGACLLTLTTPLLDLAEAIERALKPLARVGVPAHEIGMMMGIALRFVPQFASELRIIRNAQLSRGASFGSGSVSSRVAMLGALIVPLFVSAFRRAATLAEAMDVRCYHGDVGRTRLSPLAFSRRDGIACALTACLAVGVATASVLL